MSAGYRSASRPSVTKDPPPPERRGYLKGPDGTAYGSNWTVPKTNFAHFLGYKPPTAAEQSGEVKLSGSRVIEIALQRDMQKIGEAAAQSGPSFRNWAISSGRYTNEPGREQDMIHDGLDAVATSMGEAPAHRATTPQLGKAAGAPFMDLMFRMQEQSKSDNIKYLEMQYKFLNISKQHGTISNLMKVRHEAISRAIRESR